MTIFCLFPEHCIKCEKRLSACDEFINTDVCGSVWKENRLNGERYCKRRFFFWFEGIVLTT